MQLNKFSKNSQEQHQQNATCDPPSGKRPHSVQAWYFLFIFLAAILLLGRVLWPFWAILVLSLLLTGIFYPIYAFFKRALPPWLASLSTCCLIVLLVYIPLFFCIVTLSNEAFNLYQLARDSNVPLLLQQFLQSNTMVRQAQDILANYGINFEPSQATGTLSDLGTKAGLFLYSKASTWAANIMNFVAQFFIMIISIFFLLLDRDKLTKFMRKLSPLPESQDDLLIKKFQEIAGVVLIGNGISGIFQGTMAGIMFAFMDLKSPVLWGGVMAILAFLPIFGIGLILIPTAFFLFLGGHTTQAIIIFVFYITLSFSVEYLLKPKLVSSQVEMHTLLVFLAIIGGMSVFGVLGIIYGPLAVTAFLTLSEIYCKEYHPYLNENHPDHEE